MPTKKSISSTILRWAQDFAFLVMLLTPMGALVGCTSNSSNQSTENFDSTSGSSSIHDTESTSGTETGEDTQSDTASVLDVPSDSDSIADSDTHPYTDIDTDTSNLFYVSLAGDDENPGTQSLPWRTIQNAANTIQSGQTAIITAGDYNEHVTINRSGTDEENRLIFVSKIKHGAKSIGFKIEGNYVTINGFEIEANTTTWTGVKLVSGSSHTNIFNSYIHECPLFGIDEDINLPSSHTRIVGNTLEHNGQLGIRIMGSYGVIENNEITSVVERHPKGWPPSHNGNDADGIQAFGDHHTIRNNRITKYGDTTVPTENDAPHADCIQTWDQTAGSRQVLSNSIIEGNYCSSTHPSSKGVLLEAVQDDTCHDIIIRNNIFEFRDIGIAAYTSQSKYSNIFVYNNLFRAILNDAPWGAGIALGNIENYAVVNNITVNCDEHRKIFGGTGVVSHNAAWNSDGTNAAMTGPGLQTGELTNEAPLFVGYTENFGDNDYHLNSDSPLIDAGTALDNEVPNDLDNVSRPQRSTFDIGPYENF